ncbi:MAG: inositol monophosphatase family protein [Trueperaceae bacterium]
MTPSEVRSDPSPSELLTLKNRLVPLAMELGRWARRTRRAAADGDEDLGVTTKQGPGDLVTFADAEVQRRLVAALTQLLPGSGFVGEEEGLDRGRPDGPTWVIDPIDGTHNFVRNYPGFCVSIALVVGFEPVLGVIYDAAEDDVVWAVRGEGCWRGVRRLRFGPETTDLAHALVATNVTGAQVGHPGRERFFTAMAAGAAGVRASGSACRDFVHLVEGRTDLFWQFGLSAWDVAAGALLVREAGGVARFEGVPRDWVRAGAIDAFAGRPERVEDAVALARELGASRDAT